MAISAYSTLPEETERVMEQVIGCALEVHRQLGPGFLERIYRQALCYELAAHGLAYECERGVTVQYKDIQIHGQRIDLVVDDRLIVEIKAVATLDPIHQAKLISYLRTAGLRAGLLANFNARLLKDGLKRIVL